MILGIDPGLANVGWAVLKRIEGGGSDLGGREVELAASGCIKTKAGEKMEDRLECIYGDLGRLVGKYGVKEAAIEGVYFARNAKSAIKVAEVIGVIRLRAKTDGVKIFEYTPLQVKMALVGYGQASKDQVEAMVENFLGKGGVESGHVADAAAVALTHLFTNRELIG